MKAFLLGLKGKQSSVYQAAAMASIIHAETIHGTSKMKVSCHYLHSSRNNISILDILHDNILLKIQEKIRHPMDLQAWSLSCKHLYSLEALTRMRLSLLRIHMFPALARRYPCLRHLDLSSCTLLSDEGLLCVALAAGKRLLSLNLSKVCTFSNLGLVPLAKECASLLHLDLGSCVQLQDLGLMVLSQIHTLQSLKLDGCSDVTNSGLAVLALKCKNLQSLSLRWCLGITDGALVVIGIHCLDLRELDISYTEITNAGLSALRKLQFLEKLSLVACSRLDDEGLTHLKSGNKTLQTLDVSRCRNISCKGIMDLADGRFPLEHIMLSYCYLVTDPMLQSLAKFSSLLSVRFDGCDMNGIDLGLVGKCCTNLEELSLSKCKGVTDAGLSAAVVGCCSLKSIDLTCCREVTDVALLSIAASCKGLVSLKMESCVKVSEYGLQKLCDSCHLLEELDVTDSSLNDTGLMSIAKCRHLKALKLGFCENIHDKGLFCVAFTNLRELDIYRCNGISDIGISAICKGCTNLNVINMSYCTKITDVGLFAVSNLQDLRILEVRGCTELSSLGLSVVVKNCRNLAELDVKRCTSLEEFAPMCLAHYCKNLRQINLSYCSATDEGVVGLARLKCMQNMRLVHVKNVSVRGFSELLVAGESLRKVKLLVHFRDALPPRLVEQVEKRGCRLRWIEKL